MKFTLRTARKLDTKISNYLYDAKLMTHVNISIYNDDPFGTLDSAKEQAKTSIGTHRTLIKIKNSIRRSIQIANDKENINALISERKTLLDIIKMTQDTIQSLQKEIPELEQFKKLEAQKERGPVDSAYGSSREVVQFALFNATTTDLFKTEVSKLKQKVEEIDERLLERNASTTVIVAENDIEILRSLTII